MSYICHICGYDNLEKAPWGEDNNTPSFDICPCCGVEFGYEDALPEGRVRFREKWVCGGYKCFDELKNPSNWEPELQLKNIAHDNK